MPFALLTSGDGLGEGVAQVGFDMASIMQSSVNVVQQNIFDTLTIVVPAIAIVIGAIVGVKFGIKWLSKMGQPS